MTLVRVASLLVGAIGRLDRKHTIKGKQDREHIERALKKIIPDAAQYSFEYRGATLLFYTGSGALQHSVFIHKASLLSSLKKELPHIIITDIVFKGPQQ